MHNKGTKTKRIINGNHTVVMFPHNEIILYYSKVHICILASRATTFKKHRARSGGVAHVAEHLHSVRP
jgi:hypothetical protein